MEGTIYMKHNSSNKTMHKAVNNTQSIANYTRSKDAYDGNMELTNLKSSSQKVSASTGDMAGSVKPLPESTRPRKDGPGGL